MLGDRLGPRPDLDQLIGTRSADPHAVALRHDYLAAAGLEAIDAAFAGTYVSNPGSGEVVKGHALVLADLGLCRYSGTVIRDPDLFAGEFSRARRADHLLRRMGFTQALLALVTDDRPWPLYRGLSTTAAPDRPSGATSSRPPSAPRWPTPTSGKGAARASVC